MAPNVMDGDTNNGHLHVKWVNKVCALGLTFHTCARKNTPNTKSILGEESESAGTSLIILMPATTFS